MNHIQQSILLRVLTDGLGVEVESFSIVLLDIVCISLLFEAFRFPADWDKNKNDNNASRNRRSVQLLENLRFSRSKTEHPLCALGHGYVTNPHKIQMISIRIYLWHMHITFQRCETSKELAALSGLKLQTRIPAYTSVINTPTHNINRSRSPSRSGKVCVFTEYIVFWTIGVPSKITLLNIDTSLPVVSVLNQSNITQMYGIRWDGVLSEKQCRAVYVQRRLENKCHITSFNFTHLYLTPMN